MKKQEFMEALNEMAEIETAQIALEAFALLSNEGYEYFVKNLTTDDAEELYYQLLEKPFPKEGEEDNE